MSTVRPASFVFGSSASTGGGGYGGHGGPSFPAYVFLFAPPFVACLFSYTQMAGPELQTIQAPAHARGYTG
jgi:hypothetical protein